MSELRKVLKLRTVTSTSAGMALATSCYLAGLQVATIVEGELAWISILVAGGLVLLASFCFAELSSQYPTAAGIKLFIQRAFNERIAIVIGTFYVILGIAMVGAESYLLSSVLSGSMRLFGPTIDRLFWMTLFIVLVALLNIRGVQVTGFVQDLMTYVMIGFLVLVSVWSLSKTGVDLGGAMARHPLSFGSVMQAAAVGVFLFVGFEWVTPLAEETTDHRLIGKGMVWAIGILTLAYSLFVVAMWTGLTPAQRASGTPIPHILFGQNLLGPAGVALFVLMSVLASATSFNSGLLNTSRFAYAMARDNVLPGPFAKLHPGYATPWFAILALMAVALGISYVILWSGKYLFMIVLAAALECFIYVVMALCVLRLRKVHPENPRDFRIPFGATIPVIVIVVFTGLLLGIFTDVTRDPAGVKVFENWWVAVAMGAFFLLCLVYALVVPPRLKKKAAERAATRTKRRPGRG
ncbi:MAG: APC family permease [Spirochaetota bacterium]